MTSKGKTWEVPDRQVPKEKLERIFRLIAEGWSTKSVADLTGHHPSYIRVLVWKHTMGARHLRHRAKELKEFKISMGEDKLWQVTPLNE